MITTLNYWLSDASQPLFVGGQRRNSLHETASKFVFIKVKKRNLEMMYVVESLGLHPCNCGRPDVDMSAAVLFTLTAFIAVWEQR